MAMYDNDNTVVKSFDLNYISEHLKQAQWAEFIELKKRIHQLATQLQRPISILDIGVGNARIPMHLCGVKEIWEQVTRYVGTDNAQACIDISNINIEKYGIDDKTSVRLLAATELHSIGMQFDMVICTWFTPGNFYAEGFDFEGYKLLAQRLDLSHNPAFTNIMKQAYDLLLPGGCLVLGACYKDNKATCLKQEESYAKMGMHVITSPDDSFTATKEGFWSQRFTTEKLYSYLDFVPRKQFQFIDLDTYAYAMQVVVRKLSF